MRTKGGKRGREEERRDRADGRMDMVEETGKLKRRALLDGLGTGTVGQRRKME